LYDDFNYAGPDPDPDLWDVFMTTNGTVSVEGGRVKIEQIGQGSAYLTFKDSPWTIKAIRATMEVIECPSGYGRIGGWAGKVEEGVYVWNAIHVEPDLDHIWGNALVWNRDNPDLSPGWQRTHFFGHLNQPISMLGIPCTIDITFFPNKGCYRVEDQGQMCYFTEEEVSKTDNYFRHIGPSIYSGNGSCVVYFDDVWVKRIYYHGDDDDDDDDDDD
jgi:hypothetical protein